MTYSAVPACVVMALLVSWTTRAGSYSFTTLDVPDVTNTIPTDVNDVNRVVDGLRRDFRASWKEDCDRSFVEMICEFLQLRICRS
jgi:hypothetical protein